MNHALSHCDDIVSNEAFLHSNSVIVKAKKKFWMETHYSFQFVSYCKSKNLNFTWWTFCWQSRAIIEWMFNFFKIFSAYLGHSCSCKIRNGLISRNQGCHHLMEFGDGAVSFYVVVYHLRFPRIELVWMFLWTHTAFQGFDSLLIGMLFFNFWSEDFYKLET